MYVTCHFEPGVKLDWLIPHNSQK